MRLMFIIAGWVWIIMFPLGAIVFFKEGTVTTKWGDFHGSSARDAFIGMGLFTLIYGSYAIIETIKEIKKRIRAKINNND